MRPFKVQKPDPTHQTWGVLFLGIIVLVNSAHFVGVSWSKGQRRVLKRTCSKSCRSSQWSQHHVYEVYMDDVTDNVCYAAHGSLCSVSVSTQFCLFLQFHAWLALRLRQWWQFWYDVQNDMGRIQADGIRARASLSGVPSTQYARMTMAPPQSRDSLSSITSFEMQKSAGLCVWHGT